MRRARQQIRRVAIYPVRLHIRLSTSSDRTSPRSRARPASFALGLLACALLAFVGCGSHGSAAALGDAAHVALTWNGGGDAGSATLTPFYATHIVTYLGADEIPYDGAKTPLQLRQGDCAGKVVAALTANAYVPSGTQPPLMRQDAAGGVDVAIAPSGDLWVTMLSGAGADATILACGHPLSEKRQYFDLLTVTTSPSGLLLGHTLGTALLGHTLGTALTEPIVASRLDVSLAPSGGGPLSWAVRSGSCTGATVAGGTLESDAKQGAVVFRAPDTSAWWLSVTGGGGPGAKTACGKVAF
jgi:hypothetical protein